MWDYLAFVLCILCLLGLRVYLTSVAFDRKRSHYEDPESLCIESIAKIK